MIFILYSISSGLSFWSVSDTSICGNSESNVYIFLKNIKFSGEIFDDWLKNLLGTNV